MRDFKMETMTEVEMPPHSKRPRLDIVENGTTHFVGCDKTTPQHREGIHADAEFHSCNNRNGEFDRSKNGVTKSNMADGVSADPELEATGERMAGVNDKQMSNSEGGNESDNNSDISNFSGDSELAWRPVAGPMAWVQEQMMAGKDPRLILRKLVPDPDIIPDHLEDFILWKIVASIVTEPPRRKKLKHVNSIEDVVALLRRAKKIMVLTGAGVSVSCGIPDFRSRDGIYARLAVDFPDLPDPQAMFDINYFRRDPRPFFKFAKEIYPGQFEPSRCHKFISLLERQGKLLRNYTQNIDTLEQVAGIKNIIQCHGSFATATCMNCRYKVDAEAIRKDIFDQVIPHCPRCSPSTQEAVMKPDIVFFGESLPEEFHTQMAADKDVCDLLIVVGSSLKVRPVALIPNSLPPDVPQVLINREPLRHLNFDVELLGDCDVIIGELCHRLGEGWKELFADHTLLEEVTKGDLPTPTITDKHRPSFLTTSTDQQPPLSSVKDSVMLPMHVPSREIDMGSRENDQNNTVTATNTVSDNMTSSGSQDDTVPETKGDNSVNCKDNGGAASHSHAQCENDLKSDKTCGTDSCGTAPNLEEVRNWWKSRHTSISSRLSGSQFLVIPPHRYVFSGAEVYSDSESEDGQFDDADEDSSFGDSESESETMTKNNQQEDMPSETCSVGQAGEQCSNSQDKRELKGDHSTLETQFQNDKDCEAPQHDSNVPCSNKNGAVVVGIDSGRQGEAESL